MMADDATIQTSAPGSLMLLGEHAVLHGRQALVGAINQRISVDLFQTSERQLRIFSSLGNYEAPLDELVDHPSFRFVLQAVQQHAEQLESGIDLKITSDFSADIGFGSSAAVTVATHGAILYILMGGPPEPELLFNESLKTVHAVQGRGSGADLAASVFGGIVGYTIDPNFQPVDLSIPLTAVYSGYKTPTPDVILRVEQLRAEEPAKYEQLFDEIDRSAREAISALRNHDFPTFGNILNRNQEHLDQMGVNTPELQQIVSALQAAPDIFGAKISGSGLGDCAIGLGFAELSEMEYPIYHLEITPAGCQYHA
jgi:mevalonate kinase